MAWQLDPPLDDPAILEEFEGRSYQEVILGRYDLIDFWEDPNFSFDWDEVLYARSALEFVRDQLTEAQRAFLDQVDRFWREHPQAFNHVFRFHHARKDLKNELEGWVWDERGRHPPIPRSHWWWWPIEVT